MENTLNYVKELDKIPNAPYLSKAISTKVIQLLEQFTSLDLKEDHLALYANYSKGSPKFNVVIDSHLDHPTFILRNHREGVEFGSIAPDIDILLAHLPYPISIFSPEGSFLADGQIIDFKKERNRAIAILDGFNPTKVKRNDQLILNFKTQLIGDKLHMRSADNLSVTATSLDIAAWLNREQPVANVTFIFPKMEEIRQGAATVIANRNSTPFGEFNKHTLMIILEAGLMGETQETKLISNIPTSYTKGPVVRIGDNELVFAVANEANLAESIMLHSAQKLALGIQHGSSISNCDATPYTLFASTPNVVGLTVPCVNKHNIDLNMGLVAEQVDVRDLERAYYLLQEVIINAMYPITVHPDSIVNGNRSFPGNELSRIREKRRAWNATAKWVEPRLKIGHPFPENLFERTRMGIGSLKAKLNTES